MTLPPLSALPANPAEVVFTYVEVFDPEAPAGTLRTEGIDPTPDQEKRALRILETAQWLKGRFGSDYGVRVNEYSASGQVLRSTVL